MIGNLATYGYDIVRPMIGKRRTFAGAGIAFSVALKLKIKKLKLLLFQLQFLLIRRDYRTYCMVF